MVVWAIVLSVGGLCLSGFILLYLVREKVQTKRNIDFGRIRDNAGTFNEDVIQWLKQIEISFAMIADTINKQQDVFHGLIKKGESLAGLSPISIKTSERPSEHAAKKKTTSRYGDENFTRHYEKVAKLADSGLSLDEISKRLKIPRGEIDLILKFKRLSQKSHQKIPHKAQTLS